MVNDNDGREVWAREALREAAGAQLIEDPSSLAMPPLSDEKAAELHDLVWPEGYISDRIVPIVEGRNRAERRANAARARKR